MSFMSCPQPLLHGEEGRRVGVQHGLQLRLSLLKGSLVCRSLSNLFQVSQNVRVGAEVHRNECSHCGEREDHDEIGSCEFVANQVLRLAQAFIDQLEVVFDS